MNNRSQLPETGYESITATELQKIREDELKSDPLVRAEQALRMMGDSSGGIALAKLLVAFADLAPLRMNVLQSFDLQNSALAVELLHAFLLHRRDGADWQSLGGFAKAQLDYFGVRVAGDVQCQWIDANEVLPPENAPLVVVFASGVMGFGRNLDGQFCEYHPNLDRFIGGEVKWGGSGVRRWMLVDRPVR